MTNGSTATRSLQGLPEPPAGWRLVSGDGSFAVPAGGTEVRLVSVAVPSAAVAGPYTLRFGVADSVAPDSALARDVVTIDVHRVFRLRLAQGDAPRYVEAGESFVVTFLLTSEGNAAAPVHLALRSADGVHARLDSTDVVLAAGETRVVAVSARTERGLTRYGPSLFEVLASALDAPDASQTAGMTVEILPPAGVLASRLHTVPARFTLRGSPEGEAGPPFELAGAGTFAEGSPGRVEFLFRGPGSRQSSFGERDEYRLRYFAPGLDVQLGDQSYRLTPLTEVGRYATGGGASVDLGRFTVGGFANRDRWAATTRAEQAGFAQLRFSGSSRFGMSYLMKQGVEQGRLLSARGELALPLGAMLDAEQVWSDGAAGRAAARAVNLTGWGSRGYYSLRYSKADAGYPTYLAGAEDRLATVTLRPLPWATLLAYRERLSLDRTVVDTTRTSRIVTTRAGVTLDGAFSVTYQRTESDEEAPASVRSGVMDQVELVGAVGARDLRLSGLTDLGQMTDRLSGLQYMLRRYHAQADVRASRSLSNSVSVDYAVGRTLFSTTPFERWAARVDVSLRLGAATSLRFTAIGTRDLVPVTHDLGTLDVELYQRLLFGHQLHVRAYVRRASQALIPEGTVPLILIDYSVPLGIPMSKIREDGQVVVRTYDAATGQGIPGLVGRLGERTAIGDKEGRLVFRNLVPGTYSFYLDPASTGPDRIPLRELPLQTEVLGGSMGRIDIGLVRTAQISGRVRRLDFDPGAPLGERQERLIEAAGLTGTVLELRNDGMLKRAIANGDGHFLFRGVPPGTWTLRVVSAPLPETHFFEQDSALVTLEGGSASEVTFTAQPRRRPIHIGEGGDIPVRREARPAPPPIVTPPPGGFLHTVIGNEHSLMDVARTVYGDATLWPRLWVANSRRVDPARVPVGTVLRVPRKARLNAIERSAREEYYASLRRSSGRR